jgi:hypothetical protein
MNRPEDDGFLQRWLRRKNEAAAGKSPDEPSPDEPSPEEAAAPPAETAESSPSRGPAARTAGDETPASDQPVGDAAEHEITDADLPDLSELGEDSDYSMFMAKGVSREKRQAALRQLFRSPKFNVTDGLDDYCEDFTKFAPLGDIVTADMRHHAERLARKALEALEGDATEQGLADATGEPPGGGTPPGPDDGAPPAGRAGARDAAEPGKSPAGDAKDPDEGSSTRNV